VKAIEPLSQEMIAMIPELSDRMAEKWANRKKWIGQELKRSKAFIADLSLSLCFYLHVTHQSINPSIDLMHQMHLLFDRESLWYQRWHQRKDTTRACVVSSVIFYCILVMSNQAKTTKYALHDYLWYFNQV
jgi:hypothetical protein